MTSPAKPELNPANWVDAHGDYLYRYALSRLRNSDSASDVVQETFVAALRHRDQYSGRGQERSWLTGILRNKIVDYVRQRNREAPAEAEEADWTESLFDAKGHWKSDPRLTASRPEQRMEQNEFWTMLKSCLSKLPSRQADVFVLREFEDRESQEICKDLEISTSNLWVLLHRARLGLARCIQSTWATEGS